MALDVPAKRANVSEDKVAKWEAGEASPTVRQARILAHLYDLNFLEFFSKDFPTRRKVKLVPDFRKYAGTGEGIGSTGELESIQTWAESIRENALALISELGEMPPSLSENIRFGIDADPNSASQIAREALNFPFAQQREAAKVGPHVLSAALREAVEAFGVMTLKSSRLASIGARGICLSADPLPVIIIGADAPTAQSFSLLHELGHVLIGESGVSGSYMAPRPDVDTAAAVENWCNEFASCFLIPEEALSEIEAKPKMPRADYDLDRLKGIARFFGVSRHAALIRLINLGYVRSDFYWKTARAIFLEEEKNFKQFGRSKYYAARYISRFGKFYIGLVLEAFTRGIISAHNASEYIEVKNLQHFIDIRREFRV